MVKAQSGRHGGRARRPGSRNGLIRIIAIFKLVKALLLVGVGLGSLKLLNPTAAETADRWASALAWRLGPRAASAVREGVSSLSDSRLKLIGIVAFLYAGLFAVAPVITPAGTLSYTPATGVSGTALITIALMDNGGTFRSWYRTGAPALEGRVIFSNADPGDGTVLCDAVFLVDPSARYSGYHHAVIRSGKILRHV
jgi:hypothetical protein